MKLLRQKRHLKIKKNINPKSIIIPIKPNDRLIDDLLEGIRIERQPYARSILEKMEKNKNILYWNPDNLNIIINNRIIPHTNIKELLKFVTNSLVITSPKDHPESSALFHKKLTDIGVPSSWIKLSIKKKGTSTSSIITNTYTSNTSYIIKKTNTIKRRSI